jgi:acetylornithine deacetylase/succinyl-diaminopimelate desuccinylase-like protein
MDAIDEYVKFQQQFIQKIIDECGPRLPGSEEEAKGAQIIAEEFRKVAGNVQVEDFKVHPLAFIGWIPIAGVIALIGQILMFFYPLMTFILITALLPFFFGQFIRYKEGLDFLFPKAKSQNVYSIIDPPDGKFYYTIILSGHIDSSWNWPGLEKTPHLMRFKIIYGVVGIFLAYFLAIFKLLGLSLGYWQYTLVLFLPGIYFIIRFLDWDKKKASPGAMDNLAGIAQALAAAKYVKENPDKMPDYARIIIAGFGSEEAGLRGSRAFVKAHQNDLLQGYVWSINIDGVSDEDYFQLLTGELMLSVNYKDFIVNMVKSAFDEVGVKYQAFKLDVGASDACTFHRMGINTITLAAQNPAPANNYHTFHDTLDRIQPGATKKMFQVLLKLFDKIDRFASNKDNRLKIEKHEKLKGE